MNERQWRLNEFVSSEHRPSAAFSRIGGGRDFRGRDHRRGGGHDFRAHTNSKIGGRRMRGPLGAGEWIIGRSAVRIRRMGAAHHQLPVFFFDLHALIAMKVFE